MSEATVLYEARGSVALVTLNRPQALNSFTRQMHKELWSVLDRISGDKSIRAAVLTGAGRGFRWKVASGPTAVCSTSSSATS